MVSCKWMSNNTRFIHRQICIELVKAKDRHGKIWEKITDGSAENLQPGGAPVGQSYEDGVYKGEKGNFREDTNHVHSWQRASNKPANAKGGT